ncbi:MAG: glycerophosphodiester phosphodiesterase [Clostridia bacterium]|nr:glycerophosphodiester phosphodiesterase [Clostridia bacterium]
MTAFIITLSVITFIILFSLFLVCPALRRHPDRNVLSGLYIAHRGLHSLKDGIPENSLEAFKRAVKYGFAIENDIHLTKDGAVVVFHDDTLKRMCGVDKRINDLTLSEIKELRLANTSSTIPTLEEALKEIDGRVPLLIEFKNDGKTKELCTAADKILRQYKGKYFVQSFYPQVLLWYKNHNKEICRGQLSTTFKGDSFYKRLAGCLIFNFLSRPDFVSYEHLYYNYLPRKLSALLGAFPVGWTYKNEEDTEKSKNYFKTFIFEDYIPKNTKK